MQERFPSAVAGQRESESDQRARVECAENVAAGVLCDDEDRGGNGDSFAPDHALEFDTLFEFGKTFTVTDFNWICIGVNWFAVAAHRAFAGLDRSGRRFDKFQSSSMRSRGRSANIFPSARAALSIH